MKEQLRQDFQAWKYLSCLKAQDRELIAPVSIL